MVKLFSSRKFLVAFAGIVAIVLNQFVGIPEELVTNVANLVIAYVIGQGLADFGKESKNS